MELFRKPSFADSTGDAIPFYHGGYYHIFSLTPPIGTTVYPARLRTSWSHSRSRNLVDWEELPTALLPGTGADPDADGVWTGSVMFGEGLYHAYYTGYNIHAEFPQTICHATSPDGVAWSKDPEPCILPATELYESLDWRDPYAFRNEDDGRYWLLLSGRKRGGPAGRRGCVILYRSDDLVGWKHHGPLYEPYHTNCPECSEMWKMGGKWYLSYSRFSEFVQTIYRIADSPFGPWRTPKRDGIGSRRFYAAKSMANGEGRRFYFGWIHDRADRSDRGEWYWGGEFAVPHEVSQASDGELDVKLPREIAAAFSSRVASRYSPKLGGCRPRGASDIVVESAGTLHYGFFDIAEPRFMMSCKVKPTDCRDHFGFLIKSDDDAAGCLVLAFEVGFQRVSLTFLPMAVDPFWEASCTAIKPAQSPGPDGPRVAERPFAFADGDLIDVQIIIDGDLVEAFVGGQAALTYRSYEKAEHQIGLLVQDGSAEFSDIEFSK